MIKITISYRREDSEAITGRIFDRLSAIYGRDALFRDIDSIPPGIDFRDHIANALHSSDIVVIIIGPRWLGRAQGGHSRLDAEADFVRIEVETALKLGIPVIPVLIGTTRMPRPEQLPETLRELPFRNAVRIDTGQDFDLHMGRFIHDLNEIIESRTAERDAVEPGAQRSAVARIPAASRTGPPKSSRTAILVGIGLLVLLVIAGIGFVAHQASAPIWARLVKGGTGRPYAVEVNAGPIWNNDDANGKCPRVCSGLQWDGQWNTTQWGVMSVCSTTAGVDIPIGPIWNNDDAKRKCPAQLSRTTWSGQWTTTQPGTMSVCGCNPPPPVASSE